MPAPSFRRASARRILAITAGVTSAVALAFASGTAAFASDHTTFAGSKPSWATAANDVGAPPVDSLLQGQIQFTLKDPAGAEKLATAVSTPGSPLYRDDISPAAWIARFSPSVSDYRAAVRYVRSYGLQIVATPKSRLFITYRGTAAEMTSAFSTPMRTFRHDGMKTVAPSKAPSLPTSIAASVSSVDLLQVKHVHATATKEAATAAPAASTPVTTPIPCSNYYGEHTVTLPPAYGTTTFATDNCGFVGNDFRAAYDIAPSLTGKGQRVAIIDWYLSPLIKQDTNTWSAKHGTKPLQGYQQLETQYYNEADCGVESEEELIDVEAVHGLAPDAGISLVGASDCDYGIDAALSKVLDGHLANIVSNSYGYPVDLPIDDVQAEYNQQLQAAAEGIGLYYSSGDSGDNTSEGFPAGEGWEASSPWVTAVGGTTTELKKNKSVAFQTGWGTDLVNIVSSNGVLGYDQALPGTFNSGAGGGRATYWKEPSYQYGVVPSAVAQGLRAAPDIAADADPLTGLLIGGHELAPDSITVTGGYVEQTYGGTSLAAPLVAAQMALVQQSCGKAIGFANPLLYSLAKQHRSVFTDVQSHPVVVAYTSPSAGVDRLATGDHDSSLQTAPGWDDVTGLGVLSVKALAKR